MTHQHSHLAKGIIAGVALGATVGVIAAKGIAHRNHNPIKKSTAKAAKAVGGVVSDVSDIISKQG